MVLSCAGYLSVLHQHVLPGDLVVGEPKVPIVLAVVSILRPDVANLNSWEWLMICISDGHNESMSAIFLILDDELGKDNGVSCIDP